ncbi:SOS response-associated peptidase [Corynebacterium pyruviciproducens]|uniref:Abasic site processing protein n=1 Tax=Corynebacterium pyruviciproducens TaxID=598660 RepID=A0AAF0YTH5_9CORY|nr:SOS response-associated peptidase [Corynebacterium pyruviciproducens]WOT01438.1 SOS response-associated peptidase [Corynebacterium pyruviciproducens]
MCGRFVLFTTSDPLLHAAADIAPYGELLAPHGTPAERYNIAPTQKIAIVRPDGSGRRTGTQMTGAEDHNGVGILEPARWGLFPHWKKDEKGPTLFNARAETVTEKPSFRDAFKKTRCIIPMDGYYEWHTQDKTKTPYLVHLAAEAGENSEDSAGEFVTGKTPLMWAAGLYSFGLQQLSATIITTDSLAPIDWLHDRMPRFLTRDEVEQWLVGDADDAKELLHPTPDELRGRFVTTEVDSRVGNVRNDSADLLRPVDKLL